MVTNFRENMFYSTGVVNYKKSFKCNRKFFTYSNLGSKNYVGNMRYCCNMGMRLVTIDTKEKFDCMIKNNIVLREDAGVFFMVAASRLGRLDRPSWCLSNKEFNLSFAEDLVSNDTLESNYAIALTFDKPYRMKAVQFSKSGICESALDN
ncbi:uncharacterized protein LOC135938158 [Cloeon dipterum]|uniref:uncharacterized protein LOC135938158 n=1 Tax=Cloeon dipterum TaxID=197152 RepID=UPI00322026C6